jgi:hypothetical protein
MKKINKVSEIIYSMLIENTGEHFLDSGGAYGRHHQRNANKSITDFYNEPFEKYNYQYGEIERTVSVFHYLNNFGLSIDQVCIGFNQLNEDAKDWDCDSDVYGVSSAAWNYLNECAYDIEIIRTFNTYNGDSDLSQILQGSYLKLNNEDYILLQIHGGCDARGGYTNARLFKYDFDECEYMPEYKTQDEILDEIRYGYITEIDGIDANEILNKIEAHENQ